MCRQIVSYSVLWVAHYQTLRTTVLDTFEMKCKIKKEDLNNKIKLRSFSILIQRDRKLESRIVAKERLKCFSILLPKFELNPEDSYLHVESVSQLHKHSTTESATDVHRFFTKIILRTTFLKA